MLHATSPSRRLALCAALAALFTTASIRAQSLPAQADHIGAGHDTRVDFNLPAGALTDVLNAFAEASGVQLAYRPGLVTGKRSVGFSGRAQRDTALAAVLQGTGMHAVPGQDASYVLQPDAPVELASDAQAPTMLPAVSVVGRSIVDEDPTVAIAATKTRTPLAETPQSVSVIERAQMDEQNVQSVAQALRYSAGVVAETRGIGDRYDSVQMRGFGGFGGNAVYVSFLDGLNMGRGLSYAVPQVEQYGLQRIEVLRGPSSILYGQANPGGVVVLESKQPEANHVNEVMLEGGTHDRWEGAFDLGGAVDADKRVLYRFVGLARDADTQVSGTKEQRIYLAPTVTLKPSADTDITLLATYQYDPANGYYGFLPRYGTVSYNPNGMLGTGFNDGDPDFDYFRREQASVGVSVRHRINDVWTIRQNTRYMHMWSDNRTAYSSGYTDGSMRYLNRLTSASHEHFDALSTDTQAQANFRTGPLAHTVLMGIDYQTVMADRALSSGKAPSLDITAPVYGVAIASPTLASYTRQRTDDLGLYVQDQIAVGQWSFVLGGREDYASTSLNEYVKHTSSQQFDQAFTWRVGGTYAFDNGLSPFASYSESFQPITSGTTSSGAALNPSTGRQYEVGIKYQIPGTTSFTSVSLYDLEQHNVSTPDPVNSAYRVQTGTVRSRGAEVEAHLDLTRELSLIAAYSYISAWVASANDTSLGHTPVAVPRHAASLWADYTLHRGALKGFGAGAGVRFIGSTYGASDDSFSVSSYTLFDLALHYEWRNWRFGLNASNLFDRQYVAACASATQCFYGARREVLGTARFQW
ncbi:TonB-dependent siderophore receptor [Caballeronia sp. LZ028]|uniref:TonB-dependent siderophore receptor n=1 Tax=Caballeronia sp. LZ028 TaxID=3038563 RepID=UPI002865A79B|nr:TonB-dependent siderophore receptor [Caballeronia sp. LZ028]MDR5770021.1 TonB-dependent siderophore receptor [Caballeronia sp. LZ028]